MSLTPALVARSLIWSAGVHVVGLAAGYGLQAATASQDMLNSALLATLVQNGPDTVKQYVQDAATAGELWWAVAVAGSLVLASLWLLGANAASPAGPQQQRSRQPTWIGALAATLAVGALAAWWMFVKQGGALNISPRHFSSLIALGLCGLTLVYYLATALGVKPAMRPSAPLASLWLR